MQNVRNRILSIETKYFGIKFRVLENVLWRIGKKRQSETQIAARRYSPGLGPMAFQIRSLDFRLGLLTLVCVFAIDFIRCLRCLCCYVISTNTYVFVKITYDIQLDKRFKNSAYKA